YSFGARIDDELEGSRDKIARFIGAASGSQIAFTAGTTLGLNQVAFGWGRGRVGAGDEIVVTPMEHHANFVPWQQLAKESGATLTMLPLTSDGRLDATEFERVISSRTKIVAVCAMSNVLGTVNPVTELAQRAHDVGAILVVDGAQSVPHYHTDVTADDVDFLVFSGHKLYGPTGVGVIYGRADRLEEIQPIVFGGHMISRVSLDHTEWADAPARLEAGTLPIVQAIALGAAVDWVDQTGLASIHAHEQSLLLAATQRLMDVPGMTIYGPAPEHKGSIIAFRIENLHPEDLAMMLDRRAVFTRHGHHCTMPLHDLLGVSATTRASFAAYNTMDDVDALVGAIQFARNKLRLA
ncbi:MAG: aminotransferase class V-fold PLP-dependent enzyme, partial [Planctomycetaceae bacterium]